MAIQYTPYLELAKPDAGELGWGTHINTNFDKLDRLLLEIVEAFNNIDVIKLGGNPIATNKGVATPGTMRVAICNDDTNLTQIEVNTRTIMTHLVDVSSYLDAPLGVHLLDDTDQTIGVNSRPVIIFNPIDPSEIQIPLSIVLGADDGNPLDFDKGNASNNTLRSVTAGDSPDTLSIVNINNNLRKNLTSATLSNMEIINLNNIVLRDVCGTSTGVRENPLWVTLLQEGNPLRFSFSSGEYDATTLRVVNATNDPNLAPTNSSTYCVHSTIGNRDGATPSRLILLGRSIDRYVNGHIATSIASPIKGHEDGGLLTHVAGGLVGASLKDDTGARMAIKTYPLFYRNADHPEDRGQSGGKPLHITVVDPINIGNGLNVIQLGGYSISRKRGEIEEGTQRICIADDDSNFAQIVALLDIIIDLINQIIHNEPETYTLYARVETGIGTVAPPVQSIEERGIGSIYIMPATGWMISYVKLDGTETGSRSNFYSVPNMRADHTVTIGFAELPEVTFKITASVGYGTGTITPIGTTYVGEGDTIEYTFTPAARWIVDSVLIDGIAYGFTDNKYVFLEVNEDHTIVVNFKVIPTTKYTITSFVGSGSGTISPTPSIEVEEGSNQAFYISPLAGWSISSVVVDGLSVVSNPTYTFTNVRANHIIVASFSQNTHTIVSSVIGGNGTITPFGSTSVAHGSNQTYSIQPASGYVIETILVNDAPVDQISSTYTFTNVIKDYTIKVRFKIVPSVTYTITSSVIDT